MSDKLSMLVLCWKCDGEGNDGDLLWPRRCEVCTGTGFEPPSCATDDEADRDEWLAPKEEGSK